MEEKNNKLKSKIIIIGILTIVVAVIIILLFNIKTKKYNIAFETNGGSLLESIAVSADGTVVKPADPTKEGHIFTGWYYNNELYDFSKLVTSNITLEARWEEKGEDTISVEGVNVNKKSLDLLEGETSKLIATVEPTNATNKEVTWASSNTAVATVDSDGNVKAKKAGTAKIIVTTKDGNCIAKVEVKVTAKETKKETVKVTGITLNKKSLSLTKGGSSKLTATVKPANATNKNVTWSSSNPSVVTVDTNGNVKALKAGTATITVITKDGKYKATCKVTVVAKKVEKEPVKEEKEPIKEEEKEQVSVINVTGVILDRTTLSLTEGGSLKLTATVKPTNATNKNVTWSSSNPSVVTVDTNGNIKALKPGTSTITVITSDGNYKATCQVTVEAKVAIYRVIIQQEAQAVGGALRYKVSVTKDNSSFSEYERIICGGIKLGSTVSLTQYEKIKNTTSATIRLTNGTDVTATVICK